MSGRQSFVLPPKHLDLRGDTWGGSGLVRSESNANLITAYLGTAVQLRGAT